MLATEGQTTGTENPTSSTALQPEAPEAYIWVAPSSMVLTQGGANDGTVLEETTGAPNASDPHISYLASQLELERGHVRELTQQNLELSRQVHTEEYLRSADREVQHQEYGPYYGSGEAIPDVYFRHDEYVSHEATPEGGEFYRGGVGRAPLREHPVPRWRNVSPE
ncbi:hypothetical protein FH972_007991 [Carpinus fangiana]|uniref:Uncharacterized protein n=1 Tax=Carpinus fangiana TaxID=176857 RepID=A0A5N6R017_9ROSI|nr:hypothetical protein FH972_007991 [Carpinus fangiana]